MLATCAVLHCLKEAALMLTANLYMLTSGLQAMCHAAVFHTNAAVSGKTQAILMGALSTWTSCERIAGGSRPRRYSLSRSSSVNANPLLYLGLRVKSAPEMTLGSHH